MMRPISNLYSIKPFSIMIIPKIASIVGPIIDLLTVSSCFASQILVFFWSIRSSFDNILFPVLFFLLFYGVHFSLTFIRLGGLIVFCEQSTISTWLGRIDFQSKSEILPKLKEWRFSHLPITPLVNVRVWFRTSIFSNTFHPRPIYTPCRSIHIRNSGARDNHRSHERNDHLIYCITAGIGSVIISHHLRARRRSVSLLPPQKAEM